MMAQPRLNARIRNDIVRQVAARGPIDTRSVIRQFSTAHGVSKQCVSGNISWLVTSGAVGIRPSGSGSYLH